VQRSVWQFGTTEAIKLFDRTFASSVSTNPTRTFHLFSFGCPFRFHPKLGFIRCLCSHIATLSHSSHYHSPQSRKNTTSKSSQLRTLLSFARFPYSAPLPSSSPLALIDAPSSTSFYLRNRISAEKCSLPFSFLSSHSFFPLSTQDQLDLKRYPSAR